MSGFEKCLVKAEATSLRHWHLQFPSKQSTTRGGRRCCRRVNERLFYVWNHKKTSLWARFSAIWSRFFRCDFSTATQHTTAAVLSGTYRKRLKLLGCLDSDFPNETLISYKINSKINIPFFKHRKWAGQASSHRISLAEQQKEKLNYNFLLPQRVRFMKNCWWLKSHQSSSGQQARAREENSKKKKIEQIFPPFGAIFFLHFLQHFHLPSCVLFRIAPTFKFYYLCARKSHASKKASQDEHSREADQFSSSRQMKHFFPFPSDSLARTLNNKTLVRAERNLFCLR